MNGLLHLGHAFSLSKVQCAQQVMRVVRNHCHKGGSDCCCTLEPHTHASQTPAVLLQLVFASGYHKLVGKQVLFPQGFHCTGMPIKVRPAATLQPLQTLATCDHPQRPGSSHQMTVNVCRRAPTSSSTRSHGRAPWSSSQLQSKSMQGPAGSLARTWTRPKPRSAPCTPPGRCDVVAWKLDHIAVPTTHRWSKGTVGSLITVAMPGAVLNVMKTHIRQCAGGEGGGGGCAGRRHQVCVQEEQGGGQDGRRQVPVADHAGPGHPADRDRALQVSGRHLQQGSLS